MKNLMKKLVLSLRKKSHIEKNTIERFLKRIDSNIPLTKENNFYDHICSFFVPVNRKNKLIYIGHHIKADQWIPPGGHIKTDETPIETVKREFEEELKHKLTREKIELFDLSIKDIEPNPRHSCKRHYDFWFIVYTDKKDFDFIKKEFYDASWHTLEETLKKVKTPQYNKIIRKLKEIL